MKGHKIKQPVSALLFVLLLLSFSACSSVRIKTKTPSEASSAPATSVKEEPGSTARVPETEPKTTQEESSEVSESSKDSETSEEKDDENKSEDSAPSYDSYVGIWANKDDYMSGGQSVRFIKFEGNTAYFTISSISLNAARVAATEEISAEVEDDRIDFTYKDSFENRGKGSILLKGDSIHVNAEITEMSNGGYGISSDTDMHKISG